METDYEFRSSWLLPVLRDNIRDVVAVVVEVEGPAVAVVSVGSVPALNLSNSNLQP